MGVCVLAFFPVRMLSCSGSMGRRRTAADAMLRKIASGGGPDRVFVDMTARVACKGPTCAAASDCCRCSAHTCTVAAVAPYPCERAAALGSCCNAGKRDSFVKP